MRVLGDVERTDVLAVHVVPEADAASPGLGTVDLRALKDSSGVGGVIGGLKVNVVT